VGRSMRKHPKEKKREKNGKKGKRKRGRRIFPMEFRGRDGKGKTARKEKKKNYGIIT